MFLIRHYVGVVLVRIDEFVFAQVGEKLLLVSSVARTPAGVMTTLAVA